jgi:hypothetical protein
MTIKIGVKNLDHKETAIITVKRQTLSGEPISDAPDVELKGLEQTEQYVDSGQKLVIVAGQAGVKKSATIENRND